MKIFPLLMLLATSFVYGQDEACCPPTFGYNIPTRIEICDGRDIYTEFSFIYWKATQPNMDLGIVSSLSDQTYLVNGTIASLNFNYDPGFQIGLGYNLGRDDWDLFLEYTWYKNNAHASVSLDPTSVYILYPAWQLPGIFISFLNGDEKWNLKMQFLDLELGRSYGVGLDLSYRPFVGIRANWIHQEMEVNYGNPSFPTLFFTNALSITQSSKCWGIGPRIGIETNWNLGAGFTFFGDSSFDLLFTQYTKLKIFQGASAASGQTLSASQLFLKEKNIQAVRAHFDSELGFGYGTYFFCRMLYFTINASYQFQVFFDQNMFISFTDSLVPGKTQSPRGNLYVHGLMTSVSFDF